MSFPDDSLDVRVEAALGADLTQDPVTWEWTDLGALGEGVYDEDDLIFEGDDIVTEGWGRLLSQTLQIRRGRADESSRPQPSSVSFTLDNPDGWLTPDNPMSPFYGQWQRGVPLRVRVGDQASHIRVAGLAAGAMTTGPGPNPVTSLWIAVETDGHPHIRIARYDTHTDDRSWMLYGTGGLVFRWSDDGSLQAANNWTPTLPAWVLHERGAVAIHLEPDVAGDHRITAYVARRMGDPWVQVDQEVRAGTTSVHAGATPVIVGDPTGQLDGEVRGRVYAAEVRDGGPTGTLLASINPSVMTAGATGWTDGQGNQWEVVNATVEGNNRFFGQVGEIAPEWPHGDLEDNDSPGEARVQVTAAGVLRRMSQGTRPLVSALKQAITTRRQRRPAGYWPLEDSEGATQAASAMPKWGPATARDVTFGKVDGPPGSDRLPEVRGTITARMPRDSFFVLPVVQSSAVAVLMHASQVPSSSQPVLTIRHPTGWIIVSMGPTTAQLVVWSNTGDTPHADVSPLPAEVYDGWSWLVVNSSALTFDTSVFWWPVGASSSVGGVSVPVTFGRVTSVDLHGRDGWSFGHLMVSDDDDLFVHTLPSDGWHGEDAATRLRRFDAQGDLPVLVVDTEETATPLGAQGITDPLVEAERTVTADMGVLREELDALTLEYRARSALFNQAPALTLDAARSEIANPFLPVDDDQRLRNRVEVQLEAGSSAQVEDEASRARHGDYDEAVALNLGFDWQAVQAAGWRLHLGTWPGMRYPAVTVDLAVAPHLIDAVTGVREGDRIQVTNLPSQHPAGTVDLLVEGITETLSPHGWTVEFTCSPAGPWTVGVVEDDTLGRADTAGCVLDAAVDADETTWELTTTVGPEWITTASHPTEFPFDLEAGGEVVTVTEITGTGPQTATVIRAVNGVRKSHAAGTPVRLAHPAVAAL